MIRAVMKTSWWRMMMMTVTMGGPKGEILKLEEQAKTRSLPNPEFDQVQTCKLVSDLFVSVYAVFSNGTEVKLLKHIGSKFSSGSSAYMYNYWQLYRLDPI